MSYCRWSSDDFKCDLYCYASTGDYWQTYVAGFRQRRWVLLWHQLTDHRFRLSSGQKVRIMRWSHWLRYLPHWLTHKKIGLPFDGESFQDPTEEHMFQRIRILHQMGYQVPKRLLDRIEQHFHSLPPGTEIKYKPEHENRNSRSRGDEIHP